MRPALALVAAALLAGCGDQASPLLPTLPVSAVPELHSSAGDIGAEELAADFGGGDAAPAGFVRGRERVFQGESQRLDRVVSRTLEFEDAASAAGYVDFLQAHAAAAYGVGTTAEPLVSEGRRGYLIDAASCACHKAEPTLAAAVSRGSRVTYLEVNGGEARPATVEALLSLAP